MLGALQEKQTGTRPRLSPHFVYESYDEASGLFYNRGSVGFVLIANPLPGTDIAAESEISDFISNVDNMPEGAAMQILSVGSSDVRFLLDKWRSYRTSPLFAEMAARRVEFLAKLAKESGKVKDSYLLISVTVPDAEACLFAMKRRRDALKAMFKSINVWVDDVDDVLLVALLRKIWGKDDIINNHLNPHETIAEQILPADFGLFEDEYGLTINNDHHFICLEAKDRPQEWSLPLMDLFIGNEARRDEYIETDYMLHVAIQIEHNQSFAKTRAIAKREAIEKNLASGMGKLFHDLVDEYHDINAATKAIQGGDRMVHIHMHVILNGSYGTDSKQVVDSAAKIYCGLMRRNGWNFVPCRFDHLSVLLSAMPMAIVEGKRGLIGKGLDGFGPLLANIGRGVKTVSSESKALLPLIGEYKGDQKSPGQLLIGRRGQLKYFSQFGKELASDAPPTGGGLENYNLAIAGVSGSGKSVLMQDVMLSVLGVGGKVFVLDYGRSFKNLCETLGGRYIEFNPSRPISINPFATLPTGNDRLSIESRIDFQNTMPITLATMAAPKLGTSDLQQSVLSRALVECLKQKGNNTEIDDIAHWLLSQKGGQGFDREANNLGRMLYNYTTEGAYGGFFNGPPQASLDSEIIVIETDHLRNFPDLMAVVIQIMITYINNSMAKKRPTKPNLLVFDEIVKTLENPLALVYAQKIFRVVRKYKASIMVATQLMTDFVNLGPDAASLFEGATYKMIMKQNRDTISAMESMPLLKGYADTEEKKRRLQSIDSQRGEYSEFTLWGGGVNGDICRLRIDPFTLMLMSTNPTEKTMIATRREQGMSLEEAINDILRERGVL